MCKTVYDENMKYYLNKIKHTRLLTSEDEVALSKRILESEDKQAINELVENNLKLVICIAKKFYYSELSLTDLVQEGAIGLMRAAEKYDYRHGTRFSTYAVYWIKQAIKRAIYCKTRAVRLPARQEAKLQAINYMYDNIQKETGRSANVEEVSKSLKMKAGEVRYLKAISENMVRIDNAIDEKGNTIGSFIADENVDIERDLISRDLENVFDNMLETLTPREKEILEARYAVGSGTCRLTLKQIAHKMHISPETVRQIEMRIMRKIRLRHSYLKEYLCS